MKKTLIRPTSLLPNSSTPLVSPIIQSNVYVTKDPCTLDKIYNGELNGYTYAREKHPNAESLARRINILENSKYGLLPHLECLPFLQFFLVYAGLVNM